MKRVFRLSDIANQGSGAYSDISRAPGARSIYNSLHGAHYAIDRKGGNIRKLEDSLMDPTRRIVRTDLPPMPQRPQQQYDDTGHDQYMYSDHSQVDSDAAVQHYRDVIRGIIKWRSDNYENDKDLFGNMPYPDVDGVFHSGRKNSAIHAHDYLRKFHKWEDTNKHKFKGMRAVAPPPPADSLENYNIEYEYPYQREAANEPDHLRRYDIEYTEPTYAQFAPSDYPALANINPERLQLPPDVVPEEFRPIVTEVRRSPDSRAEQVYTRDDIARADAEVLALSNIVKDFSKNLELAQSMDPELIPANSHTLQAYQRAIDYAMRQGFSMDTMAIDDRLDKYGYQDSASKMGTMVALANKRVGMYVNSALQKANLAEDLKNKYLESVRKNIESVGNIIPSFEQNRTNTLTAFNNSEHNRLNADKINAANLDNFNKHNINVDSELNKDRLADITRRDANRYAESSTNKKLLENDLANRNKLLSDQNINNNRLTTDRVSQQNANRLAHINNLNKLGQAGALNRSSIAQRNAALNLQRLGLLDQSEKASQALLQDLYVNEDRNSLQRELANIEAQARRDAAEAARPSLLETFVGAAGGGLGQALGRMGGA